MARTSRFLSMAALLIGMMATTAQSQNPFLELVDALTGEESLFNGPDRGGDDSLHGEIDDHWFTDYDGLDLLDPNGRHIWEDVDVPTWQNNGVNASVNPDEPELPVDHGEINGLRVITGQFLVGAIKWPHEEYVEQYVDGTLSEIEDQHKVPVYWVVGYVLFIPPNYGSTATSALAARRGKALIIQAGGEDNSNYNSIRPPWMIELLDSTTWRMKAARNAALRLGVPVLYLGPNPIAKNAFAPNSSKLPQGGVTGYWTESLADFADHWSIKAPEADAMRDHPQFMYVASYIRARTFLEGFFNPAVNGTTAWSKWDEITGNATNRYTAMTDVIVMAGSKRGYAARLAAVADPWLTGVVANGAGCPNLVEHARLEMDELWEKREARYLAGNQYVDEMKGPGTGDANQFRPFSTSQREVDVLDHVADGTAENQLQYYDWYRVFKDRDVMRDAEHPDNPQPEVWVLNTQGTQDDFWPLQNWTYWTSHEVFHGSHQYFDFEPTALHAPYYERLADSIHGFCDVKWFGRPMPGIRITGIDFVLPIEGESPTTIPLTVHAQAEVPSNEDWPLDGEPEFDLCIALRPVSNVMSRGMWSDKPRGSVQAPEYGRQTPWWVIAPTSVSHEGATYALTFEAVSDVYADVDTEDAFFPTGFEGAFGEGLDLDGIPPDFHVALFVRVHATHKQEGADRWPVRASSTIEFLPPWIEVSENQAFGWGDPDGMLDGSAHNEREQDDA